MARHGALRSSEIDREIDCYIDNDGFILSESDDEIGSNHVEEEWRIDGDEEFSDDNKMQADSLCLGCRAPASDMKEHPLLLGSLCTFCVMTASQSSRIWAEQQVSVPLQDGQKPALRVLSLFDGISSALVVLKKLHIEVEVYLASEIDEHAIIVSKRNHGDDVTNIGSVEGIIRQTIEQYQPIHLIIGGSPCNELSKVNHKRKGIFDMDGTGPLFFEFSRIKNLVECVQKTQAFFLYENVSTMATLHKDTISRYVEIEPICVDSQNVSAMKRARLFWGNIPGMAQVPQRLERASCSTSLQDHLTPNLEREACVDKVRTVTTNRNSLTKSDGTSQVTMKGQDSTLTVNEIEKMFGFPEHYTDVMNFNANIRQKLLGKAWSVEVVSALLEPLTQYFRVSEVVEE
ncbi:DNA (cytosine-5)-methyltransferase 3C-like [Homalodisca vitripennis]|uniref:DNA (cytosine-5)-methyltransferase 3C-like n=1 Tax=Homalodisca vitripennis TaxID=197043 RepID=UPI001EEB19A5|nr:DNA (cytosine-5)-methyltransferase 3C-like [Homalodisca vitripennis]